MKDKLIKITKAVFGYGMAALIIVCLFVAIAYIIAFIVGMPVADTINTVCTKNILPIVYKGGITLCIIGIINMYLRGELLFRLEVNKNK